MEVIVIDDDMPTVDVIVQSVDWRKFDVGKTHIAYNITAAKKIIEENPIAIAICDIEMPMGSGLDLLKWVRENDYDTEFIFLTSHEKFDYAMQAIQYQASGYIVKPFNAGKMESELITAIQKLNEKSQMQKASQYEEWYSDNLEYVETVFWEDVLQGRIKADKEIIKNEINSRRIQVDGDADFILILISNGNVSQVAESSDDEGTGLYEKSMTELSSSILTCEKTSGCCINYHVKNMVYTALIIGGDRDFNDLKERSDALIVKSLDTLKNTVTVYLSDPHPIDSLANVCRHLEELDKNNVASKGKVFSENDVIVMASGNEHLLDQEEIRLLLNEKKKKELLNLLKFSMESLAAKKQLDAAALKEIRQDLLQTVHVYLYSKEIQATQLFANDAFISLEEQATDSLMNMIRYQVYLISTTIDYVSEVEQSDSIVTRAKNFIHEHYREDISRVEIAASVYLTPEYMAKMFKKETGISIKQYIAEYRITKAKELLSSPSVRISDVAAEVGFDNFSYFSTVFKKTTGYTPNEYHAMTTGDNE